MSPRTIDLRKPQEQQRQERSEFQTRQEDGHESEEITDPYLAISPGSFRLRPLSWTASHVYSARRSTTITIGILAAGAALVWFFEQNLLFALLLLMGACALVFVPRPQRTKTQVRLAADGVAVDDTWYHYQQIHSFWITYIPGAVKELSLETAHWYLPYVKVPLGDQDPSHVRSFLVEYIPEREHHHSLIDALLHLTKF